MTSGGTLALWACAIAACGQDEPTPSYGERDLLVQTPADTPDTGGEVDSADPDEPAEDPIDEACTGDDPSLGYPAGTLDCAAGLCRVEEGDFYMGSFSGHPDECPVRVLALPAYTIDRTEVTWASYQSCVDSGSCSAIPARCYARADELAGGAPDDLPVTCVTWTQATDYCEYAGGRLPSEAEWEKAARGTEGSWWPWGGAAPTCDFSNFRFVSWYCQAGVVAVGSYDNASPYGAVDMTGNAWEWVADYYDAEWYREAPGTDGPEGLCRESVGAALEPCIDRILRGGAYNVTEFNTRNAARTAARPDLVDDNIGFRCVYDE